MDITSPPYKVNQCSKCQGDTLSYCKTCRCDLCAGCKDNHVNNVQTISHDVMSYSGKFINISNQKCCVKHPSNVYRKYCESCQVPVCDSCFWNQSHKFRIFPFEQEKHKILDTQRAYETKQQEHRETVHIIRSEALFYRPVFLPGIIADIKTCRSEFSLYQSKISLKAQTLKDLINNVQNDFMYNVFCDFDFKHRCLKQKQDIIERIASLQRYVRLYELSSITPLQFLSSVKTACLPPIHPTLNTCLISMTESLNKKDVMESLSAIQFSKRKKRRVAKECLLKLMSSAEFLWSLSVTGVLCCRHISCLTLDRVWVSDKDNIIMTNSAGVTLHRVENARLHNGNGSHTVNSESELIYIDRNNNISKLSSDMKTTSTFIKGMDSTWWPRCLYWSPFTGDLLVAMYKKVYRYDQGGQLLQTIQHDNTGQGLYRSPNYVTENSNEDVVVSDYLCGCGSVVVTERGGRHRFSYKGHPSGSKLKPYGICTDAMSHILVCDVRTKSVHMLNKNGQFLSHLLTVSEEMGAPWTLCYDFNTYRLWVGSLNSKTMCVYKYITEQDAMRDQNHVMESPSEILTLGTDKPQQKHQSLLKLMSPPKLLHSPTLTGVYSCRHISFVTSDRIWVCDSSNNLILTNITGVPLHRVKDLCSGYTGLHTVNSESELIYIDRNFNINKLSNDKKTTVILSERTFFTWRPRCVYWSSSTSNLLVGMYVNTGTGKVTRYNQSGQLEQTMQQDSAGLGLYIHPNFVTENNNGDIVVSDFYKGVVVTERGGRHRFSYKGHPPGSRLKPYGICTDAMSHILVCDVKTKSIHMLNKNGQFLSHLPTVSHELDVPYSLSYDFNTHRLWVGSWLHTNVFVYMHITRQEALTDEHTLTFDGDALSSSTQAV